MNFRSTAPVPENFQPDTSTLNYDQAMHLADISEGEVLPFGGLEILQHNALLTLAEGVLARLSAAAHVIV